MMMLSASEIESLRQETKQAMLEMRAYRHKLAAAKERQESDEADGRRDVGTKAEADSLQPMPGSSCQG